MDKSYESKYHKLEENHWWFMARRDIILKLIKQLNLKKNSKILEIGCSGGPLIKNLKENQFTEVHGIDISKKAINICKQGGLKNVKVMNGSNMQFQDNEFDLIIASDILEHIKDDISALSEWRRILKPCGRLIIFVPAFNFLWSNHDEINHHYRRYSKSQLKKRLKKAGYHIEYISYWNFSLFFPTALVRTFQNIFRRNTEQKKDQLYKANTFINKIITLLLKCENWLLKLLKFPVGVSVFAVCKKYADS